MKTLCLVILGAFAATFIQGQTISLAILDSNVRGYADAYEIISYATIQNNTNDSIRVHWQRVTNNIPGGWEGSQVCDNNVCYGFATNFPDDQVRIPGNGTSNLDVHFRSSDIVGNGTVIMRAWVIGDSANTVVTGTYKVTAQEPVGVEDKIERDNLLIYPNPAKDYVMIKNLPANEITTVEVYNIFGRKMLSFSQPPSANESAAHKFDLVALPKGIYMIRIFDGDMNMIFTKSLSKE